MPVSVPTWLCIFLIIYMLCVCMCVYIYIYITIVESWIGPREFIWETQLLELELHGVHLEPKSQSWLWSHISVESLWSSIRADKTGFKIKLHGNLSRVFFINRQYMITCRFLTELFVHWSMRFLHLVYTDARRWLTLLFNRLTSHSPCCIPFFHSYTITLFV